MSETAPEVALRPTLIVTKVSELEPSKKTEKEPLSAEVLGERLKEVHASALTGCERISKLGEQLIVRSDKGAEIREGERVPTFGEVFEQLERIHDLETQEVKPEEYLQKSSPVLIRTNQFLAWLDEESSGISDQRWRASAERGSVRVEIGQLEEERGFSKIRAWLERRGLENEYKSLERQIEEMTKTEERFQDQAKSVKERALLIRRKQAKAVLGELQQETKGLRQNYLRFIEEIETTGVLHDEVRDEFIEEVVKPQVSEAITKGKISSEQAEEFYGLLKKKSSRETTALEDEQWENFFQETGLVETGLGLKIRESCCFLTEERGIAGHRSLIRGFVLDLARKDIESFKKLGLDLATADIDNAINEALGSRHTGEEDYFFDFTADSVSRKRERQLWLFIKESESGRKIFGNSLVEKDDEFYRTFLDRALTDKTGIDIDALLYYPTPEAIRALVLIAAADFQNYRTVHANSTLTNLAERPDWKTLLDKTIQQYPEMASMRGVLQKWRYQADGNNPDLEGKIKGLALSIIEGEELDERVINLAKESLPVEILLQRLVNTGEIKDKQAKVLKTASRFTKTIRERVIEAATSKTEKDREKALKSLGRLTVLSRELIRFQEDKERLKLLTSSKFITLVEQVDGERIPLLLLLPETCSAYSDTFQWDVLLQALFQHPDQLITPEGLKLLQEIGKIYPGQENIEVLSLLIGNLAELEAFSSEEKMRRYLTSSGLITKDFIEQRHQPKIKSLVRSYFEKAGEELDPQVIEVALNYRCFPKDKLQEYVAMNPDRQVHYQRLNQESRVSFWADVIINPEHFWEENLDLFVSLREFGFTDFDFGTFRGMVNNPEIVNFLRSSEPLSELKTAKERLGLELPSLHYVSLAALKRLAPELEDEFKARFYRQLLAESPRSFKNVVYSIAENPQLDITRTEVQRRIRSAINQIGNITPMVLRLYVAETNPEKRVEFIERLEKVKTAMLRNEPVKGMFGDFPDGDDLLIEFITLSFPGNSFESVRRELSRVGDRTEDLTGFEIKEDGYEARSESQVRVAALRKGKTLDRQVLEDLKLMFPRYLDAGTKRTLSEQFDRSLAAIIKSAGAFNFQEVKEQLPAVLSILYEEEAVTDFRKTNLDLSQQENVSVFLERGQELLGIYFKDNFELKLAEVLREREDLRRRLEGLLSRKRIQQIERDFTRISDVEKAKLSKALTEAKEILRRRGQGDEEAKISPEAIAGIVSVIIENRILRPEKGVGLRRIITKELEKFEYRTAEGEVTAAEIPFKGYVSKNAASYFAKTTAGICTADDIDLYNRPDHFHINLVKDDIVVGNIQGYTIEYEGKKAFLFRGFNPSVSLVNRANAEVLGDGMMSIVTQFARDNGVTNVFVTEELGGWHALTNRSGEGVLDYFKKRYLNPKFPGYEEIDFPYPITKNQTIAKMYRVPMA